MINSRLYTSENVGRANSAKIGTAALTLLVCGYLIVTSALSARDIWGADRALHNERSAAASLSREAGEKRIRDSREPQPMPGGVEIFALAFSRWAAADGVRIESMMPEGAPVESEVSFGDVKLGKWNANKVRVEGEGAYPSLMSLLDRLKDPGMPVQLESFSIRAADNRAGTVSFNLVLTVYEKKSGTT
ncbi:MAG: hypothetical protein ABFD49_06315 [Armatimonadota bacterium]|nr:hypothetical protein [bacterium]